MTKEEMVEAFPIGCKVELVENGGLSACVGATGIVYGYSNLYLNVEWDRNNSLHNHQCNGGYIAEKFELISNSKQPVIKLYKQPDSFCPRCNGELYDKQTEYCGTIKKCKDCGWC